MKNEHGIIEEFLTYYNSTHVKTIIPTEDQYAIINENGTVVCSAGAGSGKTAVLSLRFLRMLLDGTTRPQRILTLTFTKKAAREMYERIYELASVAVNSKLYKSLAWSMKDFSEATISTLDSFNSEIARTSCADYGIAKDFELLTDYEQDDMVRLAVTRTLEKDPHGAESLFEYFNPSKLVSDLFLPLSRDLNIMSNAENAFSSSAWCEWRAELIAYFKGKVKDKLDVLQSYSTIYGDDLFSTDPFGTETVAAMRQMLRDDSYIEHASLWKFDKNIKFNASNTKKIKKIGTGILFKAHRIMRGIYENFSILASLSVQDDEYWKSVSHLFSIFLSELNDMKKMEGKLSYDDISALALDILKNNVNVRRHYKEKFSHIMIDEFQDNTVQQKELLYILAERDDMDGIGVPEPENLQRDKLFFVGDAKQSIYRFRGADVSVFNGLVDELKTVGGKLLTLPRNFRSEPVLIDHFNKLFEQVFEPDDYEAVSPDMTEAFRARMGWDKSRLIAHEARFEKLEAKEATPGIKPVIMLHEIDQDDYDDKSKPGRGDEAAAIATLIEEMHDEIKGKSWLIPKGEVGVSPEIPDYSDIAVLFEKSAIQKDLEKALSARNIPYVAEGCRSLTTDALAHDLYNYVKLLLYPEDKLSFMAVLRSPFVDISDDGLLDLKKFFNPGDTVSYELVSPAFSSGMLDSITHEDDRTRFEKASSFYAKMRQDISSMKVERILDKLFYESGYWESLQTDVGDRAIAEQYEYIWNIAMKSESLFEFLDNMNNVFEAPATLDAHALRLGNEGVKLMTIHKSKGLDFPIVIIADAFSKKRGSSGPDYIFKDPKGEFIFFDKQRYDQYPIETTFRKISKNRDMFCERAESKRLLYVALTRVQTHLVISGIRKNKYLNPKNISTGKNGRLKVYESPDRLSVGSLYKALIAPDDVDEIERADMADKVACDRSAMQPLPSIGLPEGFQHRIFSRKDKVEFEVVSDSSEAFFKKTHKCISYAQVTIKGGVKEAGKDGSVFVDKGPYLGEFPELAGRLRMSDDMAPDFGTLCHETLEARFLDNPAPKWKGVSLCLDDIDILEKAASDIADRFFDSRFYKDYVEGNICHPEYGFFMKNPRGNPLVLEGSVDLLVEGEDCNYVVDYKTDKFRTPADHKEQLSRYCEAMSDIFGGKKTVGYVVYLRTMDYDCVCIWK